MKVQQFYNKNQFIIIDNINNTTYFQSYNSMVARYNHNTRELYINENWDYSNTTRKHFYLFLKDYAYSIYSQLENNKRQSIYKLLQDGKIKIDLQLD